MELLSRAAQLFGGSARNRSPPRTGPLYFDLLPRELRSYIDTLVSIDAWRYEQHEVTLTADLSLKHFQRRFVLASGEDVLIGIPEDSSRKFLIFPQRKPLSMLPIVGGLFVRFLAYPSHPDPLLLLTREGIIGVYTHELKCIARQAVKEQPEYITEHGGERWDAIHPMTLHWVLVGAFIYRLPLLSDPIPLPAQLRPSTCTDMAVFGEIGSERLAVVVWTCRDEASTHAPLSRGCTNAVGHLQVWDLRTRHRLFTLPQHTVRAAPFVVFPELQIVEIAPVDRNDMHQLYSLSDGGLAAELVRAGNRVCVSGGRIWYANEESKSVMLFTAATRTVTTFAPPNTNYEEFVHCVKTRILKYYHKGNAPMTFLLDVATSKGVEVPERCDKVCV